MTTKKKILRLVWIAFTVALLTLFTQVGGLVYLLFLPVFPLIRKKFEQRWLRRLLPSLGFFLTYCLFTFLIIPFVAGWFGRVPLPYSGASKVQPLNFMTVLLNRHYVTPDLLEVLLETADEMHAKFPGTKLAYLDANFPLFDGYPLFPHLSHSDGRKVDLAFFYTDPETHEPIVLDAPSPVGYGVHEEPREHEKDQPARCKSSGYWQYDVLHYLVPQWWKSNYVFDENRTAYLIYLFVQKKKVHRMFIEPHLQNRLGLKGGKIRYHGCQAVRHDDHLHLEVF